MAQILGDVADGGASIGRSAGDPRVDRVDTDHRSSDRACALINPVITATISRDQTHLKR